MQPTPIREQGILVNSVVLEDEEFLHGAKLVIQTLKAGAFRPNILFLTLGDDKRKDPIIDELVAHATQNEMGTIILRQHPRMAFGMMQNTNIWLRDKSPNWHLAMLITLQLQLNWEGRINLVTVADEKRDEKRLYHFLEMLSDQARLPAMTDFYVLTGPFKQQIKSAPRADPLVLYFCEGFGEGECAGLMGDWVYLNWPKI